MSTDPTSTAQFQQYYPTGQINAVTGVDVCYSKRTEPPRNAMSEKKMGSAQVQAA